MFVIAKNKKVFDSTLNEITASVRCVSSMTVVVKAKLLKNDCEKRRNLKSVTLFCVVEPLVAIYVKLLSQSWLCTR